MNRRSFLVRSFAVPALLRGVQEAAFDIAVIGGGVGGCAAALAAARSGMRTVLTEETDWIGGQLTSQAVPPDEHAWIESFGCTRLYRDYRNAVRAYYRRNYPLTEAARQQTYFNPGNSWVSRITHEPKVSLAVLESMLAPWVSGGRLTVLLRHKPVRADVERDSVRAVIVKSFETGDERTLHAHYFLDATELGDLLPLTKTEYVTGFESRGQTGEPHAPDQARPADMQAITVCFAMDYRPGEHHTIDKPDEYDFWRDYTPEMKPPYTGKLLEMTSPDPATLKVRPLFFEPGVDNVPGGPRSLWTYRRIADKSNFVPGSYASDISLVNWPQNDYWLGNICEVGDAEAARNLKRARQLSLSLLYWLQTEIPRRDGGRGWPGLRLRPDIVGTENGLAKYPYIRESRRIHAEFTVLEQHAGTEARMAATGKGRDEVTAALFADSVGVGSYRIDLHPSTGAGNSIDISSLPFQIPLGALIPKRVENLIPACKNIGVTHITNGCYRLHPVEWNIGEAAGYLAAYAIDQHTSPRAVRNGQKKLSDFQARLRGFGVETAWPKLSPR
ncbi:MAG: FAD-dependent oxidoreductase [Bryobacteraceae bacterium]